MAVSRVICHHILKARDFDMSESYLKIGSYTPETEDQEAVIDRGYYAGLDFQGRRSLPPLPGAGMLCAGAF